MAGIKLTVRILLIVLVVVSLGFIGTALAYDEPYVNPLGDLDAYDSVEYLPVEDQYDPWDMSYYVEDADEWVSLDIWGNSWFFTVPGESLDSLHSYLQRLTANILYAAEDRLVAEVIGPSDTWWVRAEYWYEDYYELVVVQEQTPSHLSEDEYNDVGDEYDDVYEDDIESKRADETADYGGDEYDFDRFPPLFNPLGAAEEYVWIHYAPGENFEVSYFNSSGVDTFYRGSGDCWYLSVPTDDLSQALGELATYLREMGAEIQEQSATMLTATLLDQDQYMWSAFARAEGEGYLLTITRERWLVPGHTWKITPEAGQTNLGFGSASSGESFQTLVIQIEQGELGLFAEMYNTMGDYVQDWSEWQSIQSIKTPVYIIDNFPQGLGKMTWFFEWQEESRPEQWEISLAETVPLPQLTIGPELGILKVSGADYGDVSVNPSWKVNIRHPDFTEAIGDVNANGEHVFYLPAGYWDLEQFLAGFPTVVATMIPVNAGQITMFTVPSTTQAVFQEIGEEIDQRGALSLSEPLIRGNQGEFVFSLASEESKELLPKAENATISEGGLPGKVLSIEPIAAAPSVVLLLDSSGSMRPHMEQTIRAAKTFVSGLSDETLIQVIDFSTTPEVLPGTTKQDVLTSLDGVRASGATALYDSVLHGLNLLQEHERPILVVFTDGVDANYDDTAPGSVATLPEVSQRVAASGVPLYTIGFGSGHDASALKQLASVSGGKYYAATDQDALAKVFTAINDTLSHSYRLVYQRPLEPSISNVPVVSLMVDTSGSMDESPQEEGCDYRMQKVKNLLHDFILDLPANTLIQVQDFNWFTSVRQSMTLDKASALYAVGNLQAAGATDTEGSLQVAYQTLSATPSQNKVLLYITDAAIITEDPEEFDWLFGQLAESDIKSVWIGIGMAGNEDIFASVAEKSKGSYLVTEEPNDLTTTLAEVLAEIKSITEESTEVTVNLSIKERGPEDEIRRYSGDIEVEKTKLAQSGEVIGPDVATYYSGGTADTTRESRVYGLGSEELQTRFIPLDASGGNGALSMEVKGATVANNIAGLMSPAGGLFVTVALELENILPAQEVLVDTAGNSHPANWLSNAGSPGRKEFMVPEYLVPSLASHLYLGWNNEGMYPVSEISWLDNEGLLVPGDMSLTVDPGQPLTGTLSFIVEGDSMSQLSLHFFDTAYGHFELDLVDTNTFTKVELADYPAEEPARLSDVFQLKVVGLEDRLEIGNTPAAEGNLFRVVELELTSKVQALLDIDPAEVFSLRLNTERGAFFLPLHELTSSLPLGFSKARMVAPGSYNKVRFVFELPEELANHSYDLYVDLRDDDVIIPLSTARTPTISFPGDSVEAEGIKIHINELAHLGAAGTATENMVVLDLTFVDEPDGWGTSMEDFLQLVRDDYSGVESEENVTKLVTQGGLGDFTSSGEVYYEVTPSAETSNLLLGLGEGIVKDGAMKRAFVLFEIPSDGIEHRWFLQSNLFADLKLEISEATYSKPSLLKNRTDYVRASDEDFEEALQGAIAAALRRHEALQAAQGKVEQKDRMDLSGVDDGVATITPPLASAPGLVKLEGVTSPEQLMNLLQEVRWLPGHGGPWQPRFAPEAALTQMWGTAADLACLAEKVLLRLGLSPERSIVEVTAAGREQLALKAGLPPGSVTIEYLPALKYKENGEDRMLILPFAQDITVLGDYTAIPIRRLMINDEQESARIEVYFNVIAKGGGFASQFGDFASALAGGEPEEVSESLPVLSATLSLADLSLDPVDLVYVSAGQGQGEVFTAVLETPAGRFVGQEMVDTGEFEIKGATIEIFLSNETFKHELVLAKDQKIDEVAQTIAINAPDLVAESAQILQTIADTMYSSTDTPDTLSVLQWYTRSIINQFIAAQTQSEQELADTMKLTIGRSTSPRVLAVTVQNSSAGQRMKTSIDLINASNQVHNGELEERNAFHIGSGLMASSLEAQVLGEGAGIAEIWSQLPPDTAMLWIDEENLETAMEVLEETGFDQGALKHLADIHGKALMVPLEKVSINGIASRAWLEIDKETLFTVGVIESGEHGAMVSQVVLEMYKGVGKYIVGALKGVEVMLWGVSSYALVLEDYDEILAAAEQEARALAKTVKDAFEMHGKLTTMSLSNAIKSKIKSKLLPDLGFAAGMVAGIDLYLENARH